MKFCECRNIFTFCFSYFGKVEEGSDTKYVTIEHF
jgi:hypothetical protein